MGKARILSQGDPMISGISAFRATKYLPDYPAFAGRDLTPGDPIELNPDLSLCPTTDIFRSQYEGSLNVYPNPFTDIIKISVPEEETHNEIKVYDLTGTSVHSEPYTWNKINLGFLSEGIYIIRIGPFSKKVVKF